MDEHLRAYVERVGLWADSAGMPRSVGRVLGWLLVCDPPEASAQDIAEGLEASAGSVSAAIRMLTNTGMAERVAVPGDRRLYVRMSPDTIDGIMEGEVARIETLRALAADGLDALAAAGVDDRRTERVAHLHELALFFGDAWPDLLQRWREQHPTTTPDPTTTPTTSPDPTSQTGAP